MESEHVFQAEDAQIRFDYSISKKARHAVPEPTQGLMTRVRIVQHTVLPLSNVNL